MKGIRHLVDGLALALEQDPRLRLAIVGSGPERAALAARAQALGIGHRVTFAGESRFAAMPALHAAADIFVLPSVPTPDWQEQWGQSLLEAMASGKPAIASDTGGVSEVLGDAGLRVAPGDAVGIADALVRLAGDADLALDLGKRARARVQRSFSHGDQARARAELYRSLAGGRSRA
jgi:glycosyltransferase involved in cell wall biosynthesis